MDDRSRKDGAAKHAEAVRWTRPCGNCCGPKREPTATGCSRRSSGLPGRGSRSPACGWSPASARSRPAGSARGMSSPCGHGPMSSASRRRASSARDSSRRRRPPDPASPALPDMRPTDVRRSPGLGLTGAGVVVAAVDWGVDVDSAAFRWPGDPAAAGRRAPAGATRFLSFWDQRDQAIGPRPDPYGYGSVHGRERDRPRAA